MEEERKGRVRRPSDTGAENYFAGVFAALGREGQRADREGCRSPPDLAALAPPSAPGPAPPGESQAVLLGAIKLLLGCVETRLAPPGAGAAGRPAPHGPSPVHDAVFEAALALYRHGADGPDTATSRTGHPLLSAPEPREATPPPPPRVRVQRRAAAAAEASIRASKRALEGSAEPESPPPTRARRMGSRHSHAHTLFGGSDGAERPARPRGGAGAGTASSPFRGVSRHRLTQRWEASLWLTGKQLYLGGFESEEDAAHAYDLAALACKGRGVPTNFPASHYRAELAEVASYSQEEIVAWVRRRSSAFSRGRSRFRGVSGQQGRWEARIGTFAGRKNVSFGIWETEEHAARQYDRALIVEKGRAAKTNFPLATYEAEVVQFEALLRERCGSAGSPTAMALAAKLTLPLEAPALQAAKAPAVPERNKGGRPRNNAASLIYAEALRHALATSAPRRASRASSSDD
ncbi:hypothetical protein WJX81_001839 [Elliptochloris bilobata]|uniref:AP2/ERF domain-containing protein n=1 Tax=Elliptochloris bilobata TaxID=381761 RepID=A0AAW1QH40_9CHLO